MSAKSRAPAPDEHLTDLLPGFGCELSSDLGIAFAPAAPFDERGFARWCADLRAEGVLPAPYSELDLRAVACPPPPALDPTAPLEDRVLTVLRAWSAAWREVTGERVFTYRSASAALASPQGKALRAGVELLTSEGIRPLSWLVFSMRGWVEMQEREGKRAAAPPLAWALARSRIERHRRWYESRGRLVGMSVTPPEVLALTDSYRRMDARLRSMWAAGEATRDGAAEVVAAVLGPRPDQAIAGARRALAAAEQALADAVARGEWLWG